MRAVITSSERSSTFVARRTLRDTLRQPDVQAAVLAFAAVLAAGIALLWPDWISHAIFIPIVVAAGILLSGRRLWGTIAFVVAAYGVVGAWTWGQRPVHFSAAVSLVSVLLIVVLAARQRRSLGVSLNAGSTMLRELRERLDRQALFPELPSDFHAESCVMPAEGGAFSGDFVVSARQGPRFEVALTDVSGSGTSAGTRALLLSGALSGLLGETSPERFLPAANQYLIRQGWRDGFASAIHVHLDLASGAYTLGTAGHPTAAQYHADRQRWQMVPGASGLLLGLFEQGEEEYARAEGVLEPGDILLLYTDGVVESQDGDLVVGTQRMLAEAQACLRSGFEGVAHRICTRAVRLGDQDDRSVVTIWRDRDGSVTVGRGTKSA